MRKYKRAIIRHRMELSGYRKICKKKWGDRSFFSRRWRDKEWKRWKRSYYIA